MIQLDDPARVVVGRGYEPDEGLFELPLRAYAEILRDGQLEGMDGVNTFILAYRDPEQSVIEIPFSVMRDWVRGRLSVGALRQQVKFSVLSAG